LGDYIESVRTKEYMMNALKWLGEEALRVAKVRRAIRYARGQRKSLNIKRALEIADEAGLIVRLSWEDLGRVLLAVDMAYYEACKEWGLTDEELAEWAFLGWEGEGRNQEECKIKGRKKRIIKRAVKGGVR
jgi:hypothetical protein